MKILFIYEYGTEVWSTPSSLMEEFKARDWEVDRFHLSKGDEKDIFKKNYDIIITMDWKGIDISEDAHYALPLQTFKIRENGDTPQNFNAHVPLSDSYDLILTPDYLSAERYKELGVDTVWFNHFADTRIHNTNRVHDNLPLVRSTRGPGGSQFMDALSRVIPNKFINKNGLTGIEYGIFLSSGKIVLQNSRWKEITRRIFEGMACGSLVLTDRLPDETNIKHLFKENENIVYYDNFSDCISKINYYLCDDGRQERKRIADNGYNTVLKNHTQVQRVDIIIEKYKKWKHSK